MANTHTESRDEWREEFRAEMLRAWDRSVAKARTHRQDRSALQDELASAWVRVIAETLARERSGTVLEWATRMQLGILNARARRELDR